LLVFLFVGCDTEEPVNALVGTWSVDAYTFREMGRASETQVIVDLDLPSTGSFEVSGATATTLGYVGSFNPGNAESRQMRFTSYDPSGPVPDDRYSLELTQQPRDNGLLQRVVLTHSVSGFTSTYFTFSESPPYPFSQVDVTISIDANLPRSLSQSEIATVQGTLTLGNRTLRAGEDDLLSENIRQTGVGIGGSQFAFPARYTFSDDGALRIVTTGRSGSDLVETGTWELIGDQLTYSVADGRGEVRTGEHEVQWRGSTLVLANQTSTNACDAPCRYQILAKAAGKPGTLLAYWQEREIVLSASNPEG